MARDEEARDDVEDVHPDVPTMHCQPEMIQDNDEDGDGSQALDVGAKGPGCALTARHRPRGCGSTSRRFSWSHDHLHDASDGELEDRMSTWARPASPVHRSHRPSALLRD